jgi:hypothetical protein
MRADGNKTLKYAMDAKTSKELALGSTLLIVDMKTMAPGNKAKGFI